ncbi:hypothetical protein V1286_006322 [Bradyrhizobium algeriense]|uniref:Uncharacterized protein n=1 Tax=Bradyrhizobium algeriense TaxID=634784 RepID=A0ABU8BJR9_9BRAD
MSEAISGGGVGVVPDVAALIRATESRGTILSTSLRAKAEAIHSAACGEVDCFAEPVIGQRFAPTRWLAMTADIDSPSRGADRPRFASSFALLEIEGAGKTGCLLHPRSRVRFAQTKVHTSIQGSGSIPAFPAQWLYGLLRALPGERLSCLRRHERSFASPGLSASTAAPEPHDFAVRSSHTRQSQLSRPPHLTARS